MALPENDFEIEEEIKEKQPYKGYNNSITIYRKLKGIKYQKIQVLMLKQPKNIMLINVVFHYLIKNKEKYEYEDIEDDLFKFVETNRKLGNNITVHSIIYQLTKLKKESNEKEFNELRHYVHRFMNNYYLTFRSPTHIGQLLPNCEFVVNEFYKDSRAKILFGEFNLDS